jgi:hypothetical protein
MDDWLKTSPGSPGVEAVQSMLPSLVAAECERTQEETQSAEPGSKSASART